MTFISIQEAITQQTGEVQLRGWVYRERGNNKLRFIVLRDHSSHIQCVVEKDVVGEEQFQQAKDLQIEASITLTGTLKADDRAPNGFELVVSSLALVGASHEFPIQKDQSPEHLLDYRHLAIRSRRQTAIFKIRSAYIQARDEFFRNKGFYRFDTPILQPTQSEGGSTLFEVSYYDTHVYLAQTWQLYGEAGIFSLEKIYNFGPTFRAEKSKTSRHLSEFWMAEMECAWLNLQELTDFAQEELKYCISQAVSRCREEFIFLEQDPDALLRMCEQEWPSMKYREALAIIKEKDCIDIPFGKDLRTEEERALMNHFQTPVCVTHYPVEAMGFYKPRDPNQPDEALCFDMLSPTGVEIIGGSERSLDIEDMKERLKADGEDPEQYDWYFDSRRYGSVPHAGYGVGTERVIAWICGLDNVKDAIAFPRTMLRWKP